MLQETTDRTRQPIHLALTCARKFQSGQTGFIHYTYKKYDDEGSDTIPFLENFLFALALLRFKMSDTIQEGKVIIDKLLHFQCDERHEESGNFPVYIHEYPHCRDRYYGLHLLRPMCWMLKDFHAVLGAKLLSRLKESAVKLLHYCLENVDSETASSPHLFKLAATTQSLGESLEDESLRSKGEELVKKAYARGCDLSWYCPRDLGDLLASSQLITDDLSQGASRPLWDHITRTWHRGTGSYVGPALYERQKGSEPEATLYDLYLGHLGGAYSYRSFVSHPFQMQAALIRPHSKMLEELAYPATCEGEWKGRHWQSVQTERYAYSCIESHEAESPSLTYRLAPFRMIWGDLTQAHSLAMQGGTASDIRFIQEGSNTLNVDCVIPASDDLAKELVFYVDKHEKLKKRLAEKCATVFQLGEEIHVEGDRLSFNLSYEMLSDSDQGQVRFTGHLNPGNRPAQMSLKGENRFKAFDDVIFLRRVRQKEECKLRLKLALN
jgi:hypothetical protein